VYVLNFPVENIEEAVSRLNQRGVHFEHYNEADLKTDEKGVNHLEPVLEIDVKKSVESFFNIGKQWIHEHNAFDQRDATRISSQRHFLRWNFLSGCANHRNFLPSVMPGSEAAACERLIFCDYPRSFLRRIPPLQALPPPRY